MTFGATLKSIYDLYLFLSNIGYELLSRLILVFRNGVSPFVEPGQVADVI